MNSKKLKGRGICENPAGRFERFEREKVFEAYDENEKQAVIKTQLHVDTTKSIISSNNSPDVPFNRSINPYRGCEHGCVYCFARPTHSWLGFSPGLEFETQIAYKPNAAQLLEKEFSKPSYRCEPIVLGANTDAYQPVERDLELTRRLLETFEQYSHPVAVITKSSLIKRDLDVLIKLAGRQLVLVHISICTLDNTLSRKMEPRASFPKKRLEMIKTLTDNGIPVNLLLAPVIPVLNDAEMEAILEQAYQAGARSANYVLLRLPHELQTLFANWLSLEYPLKANHVMSILKECRGGQAYDSSFGQRMTGKGSYAEMINSRFNLARKRFGYDIPPVLNAELFRANSARQLTLF